MRAKVDSLVLVRGTQFKVTMHNINVLENATSATVFWRSVPETPPYSPKGTKSRASRLCGLVVGASERPPITATGG